MYIAFGSSFLIVGFELERGSVAQNLFIIIMLAVFFLVVFNKGIDRWLKSLDGERDN
jgi:hypothetical protein